MKSIMRGAVLGLLLAAPAARAADTVPAIQTVTLSNGLRAVLAPDDRAASVDLAVWYDSGSRAEREGQTGIAHLFEHLMFRGSGSYGPREHTRLLQQQGGSTGAYTTGDYTCFFQTVPPEALDLAIKLEADRMATLKLTPADLDLERRAVADERARHFESSPLGQALGTLYATAFPGHPYRWPVLGRPQDLAALTPKDVQAWYRARYAPSRAVVTVVGRFDPVEVTGWLRRSFQSIPRGGGAVAAPKLTAPTAERRAWDRTDVEYPMLLVGWRGPAYGDPDLPALRVISMVLTRGESSRLHRALVEGERVFGFAQGDLDSRRDASLLYMVATVNPAADTLAVERLLGAEIQKLAEQPLTEVELERAKRAVEVSLLFSQQGVRGRAQVIGSAVALGGDPGMPGRLAEQIRALTAADIQKTAARLLVPARRTVVWLAPRGSNATGVRP